MRSVSVAVAAIIGGAAANPVGWPRNEGYNPYPTGGSSSSSSSSDGYPASTPSSSLSYSTYGYPSSSSSEVYPTLSSSTYGYPLSSPSSIDYPPYPSSSDYSSIHYPTSVSSSGTGYSHPPPPIYTGVTSNPPSYPTGPATVPTTVTTSTYTWVPCSTSVGYNDGSTIYSTYLTPSYYPTTYVTTAIVYPTLNPLPPHITKSPVPEECPYPVTVYNTVTVTVGEVPEHYTTKTYTVTESGSETVITVTIPDTSYPTSSADSSNIPNYSDEPEYTTSNKPEPPKPTGYPTGYPSYPSSFSSVPYPTVRYSSSAIDSYSSHVGPQPTGYSAYYA